MKFNKFSSTISSQEFGLVKEELSNQADAIAAIEDELPYKRGHWYKYAEGTTTNKKVTVEFDKPISNFLLLTGDNLVLTKLVINDSASASITLDSGAKSLGMIDAFFYYYTDKSKTAGGILEYAVKNPITKLEYTLSSNSAYELYIID